MAWKMPEDDKRNLFSFLIVVAVTLAILVVALAYVNAVQYSDNEDHSTCQALKGVDSRGDRVTVYLCPTPTGGK
jgi:hypothetical protein